MSAKRAGSTSNLWQVSGTDRYRTDRQGQITNGPASVKLAKQGLQHLALRNTCGIRPLILGCVMASRKAVPVTPVQAPAPRIEPEPILTIQDIATRLRFENTSTVYELTRKRNRRPMPCMRAGKVLRFYFSEVEKWLREGGNT